MGQPRRGGLYPHGDQRYTTEANQQQDLPQCLLKTLCCILRLLQTCRTGLTYPLFRRCIEVLLIVWCWLHKSFALVNPPRHMGFQHHQGNMFHILGYLVPSMRQWWKYRHQSGLNCDQSCPLMHGLSLCKQRRSLIKGSTPNPDLCLDVKQALSGTLQEINLGSLKVWH